MNEKAFKHKLISMIDRYEKTSGSVVESISVIRDKSGAGFNQTIANSKTVRVDHE